jgi:mono/diheme cytochrome c family protein
MRLVKSATLALGFTLMLIVLPACNQQRASEVGEGDDLEAPTGESVANASAEEQIHHGRYLVRSGGCNDCHTPWIFDEALGIPRPDMSRMLSGHPKGGPDPEGTVGAHDMGLIGPTFTSFALPFGIIYSLNLTPDMDTGIGSWTEEMFLDVFRKGRHLGGNGRGVLPPMPWLWIRNLSDDDLRAVYAYLRSIPPISNAVPEPKMAEEVIWQLRDSFDQLAAELPQEEWATKKE